MSLLMCGGENRSARGCWEAWHVRAHQELTKSSFRNHQYSVHYSLTSFTLPLYATISTFPSLFCGSDHVNHKHCTFPQLAGVLQSECVALSLHITYTPVKMHCSSSFISFSLLLLHLGPCWANHFSCLISHWENVTHRTIPCKIFRSIYLQSAHLSLATVK